MGKGPILHQTHYYSQNREMSSAIKSNQVLIVDKSKMNNVILDFPKQFAEGLRVAGDAGKSLAAIPFQSVIVAGMGGSALAGELLKLTAAQQPSFLARPIYIHIHRNYGMPSYADARTLVVCVSHSGNTEETLDSYEEAVKQKIPVIALTKGGKLAQLAQRYGAPIVLLPETSIQPRSALGYQFAALLKVLNNAGIISSQDKNLLPLETTLQPKKLEKEGKKIARKLIGRTPLIYSSQTNKALAYILKIKFNENAKTMAFWNYFPELNHNEMVGFTKPQNKFTILMLRDENDNQSIQKRMELTSRLAAKYRLPVLPIDINGDKVYNRIFTTLLLGDWISYYLALWYRIDPTPVNIVEELKKGL